MGTEEEEIQLVDIPVIPFTMDHQEGWTLQEFIHKTLPANPNTYKMPARLKKAANIPLPNNVHIDLEPVGGIYSGQHQEDLFWQQKSLVKILGISLFALSQNPEGAQEFINSNEGNPLSPQGKLAEILFGLNAYVYHTLALVREKRSTSSIAYLTNTKYKVPPYSALIPLLPFFIAIRRLAFLALVDSI
eukprot:TRINITY_DN1649_c0_g1_i1.p1 TRINITY_DN1649_c0_g1~~TRINITY_DN1649_c0_g1_i1.p1  ORF type:complete len:189 (-),score=22.97 TRINITY_DN1649_c0_g1_i1:6-572(-)